MGKHRGRWAFLWDVVWRNPVASTCAFLWSALSALDLTKSQFFPDRWQHWQIVAYLPNWSWGWWFALSFFLVFLAVWLGSFKRDTSKDAEIAALKNPLPILTIEIRELYIIVSGRSDVFIKASVTNDSHTDTLIKDYRLNLTTYSGHQYQLEYGSSDVSEYQRIVTSYSERGHSRTESQAPLEDFARQITREHPLKYGLPVTGWLHFRVEGGTNLPPLEMSSVKECFLYLKDSCTNSPIHAVVKVAPLDNPVTTISKTWVYQ
jgi:hypothetical protein